VAKSEILGAGEFKDRGTKTRKYLYAIIPCAKGKGFGDIGIEGENVYTLIFRDIAAIVSDTLEAEYELTEQNARKHDAVLRQIMSDHTVIPVEFGTVFQNDVILKQLLSRAYHPIKRCLPLVDNVVEVGLKAVTMKDSPNLEGELGKPYPEEILRPLKERAVRSTSGEIFSDRLVLNESFLVKRDGLSSFSEEVARLEEEYPTLRFLYSGPWAPYNFVHIRIGRQGIEIKKSE